MSEFSLEAILHSQRMDLKNISLSYGTSINVYFEILIEVGFSVFFIFLLRKLDGEKSSYDFFADVFAVDD